MHVPGGYYQVMLRGNGRDNIFMIDQDREAFSSLIAEGIERYQHRIHAFCWMSNHVHLLIEVEERPLSDIIQNVSFRYTRYLNRRIKRMGHLFQGRYKALLVNEDQYLLELVRYIHLNPVRAEIAKTADAFRWSGHHAYLGREKYFWLIQEEVLARISKRKGQARALYAQYISEGIGERRRAEFHRGGKEVGLLGDDTFIEKIRPSDETIKRNTVPTENLLKAVLEREGVSETEIRSASRTRKLALARQWLAYLSSEFGEENLTQLGQFLRQDVSTLSNGVRKIWTLTQNHSEWKQKSVRYQMQINKPITKARPPLETQGRPL